MQIYDFTKTCGKFSQVFCFQAKNLRFHAKKKIPHRFKRIVIYLNLSSLRPLTQNLLSLPLIQTKDKVDDEL
jgi:hypothetical protein